MALERKIVDEVSGWLRLYDDGSVDRSWLGPPEAKFMVDPVPPHDNFIDGVVVRDVETESGNRVRVYMPELKPGESDAKLPILVHFPGGGFCISQPDWFMYYAVYSKLAQLAKAIVVSVYLRLAPEHRLPAAVDDGLAALLWLRDLSGGQTQTGLAWFTTKADFQKVFLIGDSSGGLLVHEVAVRAGETKLEPLKLAGLIPVHPGVCRAERSRSELEMPQTPFLTLDMVDKFLSLALPIGSTKDHPITCPMGPAAPPMSELHLPPIMLCVAEKDLFIDTNMEYYEALKKAGKDVELFISHNMTHSFYLNRVAVEHDPETKSQNEKLFEGIVDFIKRH